MKPGSTFKYPVPDFMKFQTPELRNVLDRIRETEFFVKSDGKVDLPQWLSETQITIGNSTYQMGIGGLHSTEASRATHSDDEYVLTDADVRAMYPTLILMLGLYPHALGPEFLVAFRELYDDRIKAKARIKAIKKEVKALEAESTTEEIRAKISALRKEEAECKVRDAGGKVACNGTYGKLGSRYSVLYAPHLMISVTLTGQLTLLMLIERAEAAGIPVVSGNTDGVLFRCPRGMTNGLNGDRLHPSPLEAICSQWERETGMDLEFGEYESIYNQSVNSYFAIKPDGGHKRKGPLGNPWNKDPSDFDPVRGQLMKNPQATICSDAALALIKNGTPVEETVRASRDIREFVTVIKASKGATWNDRYLGKVVRFYWGIGGAPIMDAVPHPSTGNYKKVPKSDGCRPLMDLPDTFPDDIDYDRYVAETESILRDLGYYGEIKPPQKRIRITKANRFAVLSAFAVAG